jgi:methylmalonyl-CoA mutase
MTTAATPDDDAILPLADAFEPATREAWLALVGKVLKGGDFERRLVARTEDGIRIEPLYTRRDLPAADSIGEPGAAPHVRGVRRAPKGLGWQIRQRHAEADPKLANGAVLEDLEGGVEAITLAIAAPGRAGLAAGEEALSIALDGVYLDMAPIALEAGESYRDAAAALMGVWSERKVPAELCRASFGADPLGTLARNGTLAVALPRAVSEAARFAADPLTALPGSTALLADGRVHHEAGASEAQELAATAATLVAYLRALEGEGVSPAAGLARIEVALAADADLVLTIAKLRAARRLLWRIAEACNAGEAARRMTLTVTTSERMLARRDPWVNMLRATAASAGAVLGGADAVTVLPFTHALGRPDAFARRIARNTQIVLQEESHLGRVVDPAGGSYAIERLTDELARKAWTMLQEIEAEGGMGAALQSGLVQDQIAAVVEARSRSLATMRRELTGVSAFPRLGDDGVRVEAWPPTPPIVEGPVRIEPLPARRLAEPFERLRDAAEGRPEARVFLASLGEIADHNVRSTWIKSWLAVGGLDVTGDPAGYRDSALVGQAFAASGAAVACIASSDAVYGELAEAAAMALKGAGAGKVYLAGRPGEQEAALRAAGVDTFVFAGADAVALLTALHADLGIA